MELGKLGKVLSSLGSFPYDIGLSLGDGFLAKDRVPAMWSVPLQAFVYTTTPACE